MSTTQQAACADVFRYYYDRHDPDYDGPAVFVRIYARPDPNNPDDLEEIADNAFSTKKEAYAWIKAEYGLKKKQIAYDCDDQFRRRKAN